MAEEKPQSRVSVSGMSRGRSQRDLMGPLMVDQTLRQSIMHCWMMLPEDQRSPENVEKEMTRLLKRALKDMRDDASSFGFSEVDN